ncbi:MAG: caspase family protein [Oscillatoriaceae bacterium SKW80]|nr:caspase family protein [Oscillatoriaceae bacterium SKYG93]MCX8120366.1 caspase family protein [Oscillatoriaceae bacterium SKW80]MDW8453292.1 caspase family protein [Oscillatoriaceae cyanobacterium SKYGB_i_bin93]HIK27266.1 caspase family protein [Oscillatoriaceae cyanobacterium M7585_C2015_266]
MTRYALVVGIGDYDGLPSLTKPSRDAEAVAQRLEKHGDFKVERLPKEWNAEKQCYEVVPERVTGKQLGQALLQFFQQAKGNEALIYFSGHGITVVDELGQQKGYLAASDCIITIEGKQIVGQQHGVSLDSLNDVIEQAELKSLVVLLDCCHAEYFLEGNSLKKTLQVFNHKPDTHLIAACRSFAPNADTKRYGWGYSIFTTALLEGLLPENASIDGQVRLDDLFAFILRKLENRNWQFGASDSQQPIRMGSGSSIVLVSYPPKQTPTTGEEICPYQGLQSFDWSRSRYFFGRRQVTETLRQKLEVANFVPLIGASGSGKSSLIKAGLIPSLEARSWRVLATILPGNEPLTELKYAFAQLLTPLELQEVYSLFDKSPDLQPLLKQLPISERVLLVVDQFEEVFALCSQEAERRRFIQLLCQVAEISNSQLAIALVIRADFLEPCLKYPLLTQLIQDYAVYMPPLLGEDLNSAITSPALLTGFQLEPDLLDAIVQDFQEIDSLPLLQFALTQLWHQRDIQTRKLTLAQYQQLGGISEALNRHAENLYASFTQQQRDWIEQVFLKLVRPSASKKIIRQRQPISKLQEIVGSNPTEREAFGKAIEDLVAGGLLTLTKKPDGETWVDLAHEAVTEGWQRFAHWLNQNLSTLSL